MMPKKKNGFPENLYNTVFWKNYEMPCDAEQTAKYVILNLDFKTERERDVLKRHYINGETYKKIADSYGLTASSISQWTSNAIRRIRCSPARERLFLGNEEYDKKYEDIQEKIRRDPSLLKSIPIEYCDLNIKAQRVLFYSERSVYDVCTLHPRVLMNRCILRRGASAKTAGEIIGKLSSACGIDYIALHNNEFDRDTVKWYFGVDPD